MVRIWFMLRTDCMVREAYVVYNMCVVYGAYDKLMGFLCVMCVLCGKSVQCVRCVTKCL